MKICFLSDEASMEIIAHVRGLLKDQFSLNDFTYFSRIMGNNDKHI